MTYVTPKMSYGSRSPSYRSVTEFYPHDKVRTARTIATKLGKYIPFVMLSTWSNFGYILFDTFFHEFFRKNIDSILGNGALMSKLKFVYLGQKWFNCHETKKSNISIEYWASHGIIRFHLGHDIDLEFSRSTMIFAVFQPKMIQLPRNKKQTYEIISWPQMEP